MMEPYQTREIEMASEALAEKVSEFMRMRDEIERLQKLAAQRGVRMQIMREYFLHYSSGSSALWNDFLRVNPWASKWFDEDGVPK